MAVHVVGFKDIVKFDGQTKIIVGRELLEEMYDTAEYKKTKPGDSKVFNNYRKDTVDFVAADSFVATLEISNEHYFSSDKVMTMLDSETRTFYPMFVSDFLAMASKSLIDHGEVTGRFGYVKKNKNFGIQYLSEA